MDIARLQRLFEQALALPAAERADWIRQACAGDAALAQQLHAMLAAADDEDDPLQAAISDAVNEVRSPLVGRLIGPYRLLEEIGSGGMGTVYEAVRDGADFEQRVAIKLLRLGLRDPRSLARFRRERQLLAKLSHPNIASLIDGGTAEDGTPWVAMELIHGLPITAWADQHDLSLRRRIKLFARLCAAVGHAHHNLVVHRDLKPANVLVNQEGEPKVLDFGIGKLLDDQDQATATLAIAFTPSHAAPEQLRGDPVTPASDVYALGILLYELVTGELPYQETPRSRSEWIKVAETGARISTAMTHHLPADLQSIMLMALRPESARRYATATALGDDLERYLDARPVRARPDAVAYRIHKYIQRHPVGILASVIVFALAVAFVTNTLVQSRRLAAERDRALHEAAIAQATTDFLVELFHAPDPKMGEPGLRAIDLLDRATDRIEGLEIEPLAKARLYHVMGLAYGNLGQFDTGVTLMQQGLAIRREIGGGENDLTADSMNRIGDTLRAAGRFREAEPYVLAALQHRIRTVGGDDSELADSYNNVGLLQYQIGHYGQAADHLESSIAMHQRLGNDVAVAIAQHNLALVRLAQADATAARELVESALAIKRAAGQSEHSTYANSRSLLARALLDAGDLQQALIEADGSLALRRQVLPASHPQIAAGLATRADILAAMGRDDEALDLYDQAVAIATQAYGESNWSSWQYRARRAQLLELRGQMDEAAVIYRRAMHFAQTDFDAENPHAAAAALDLVRVLSRTDPAESRTLLEMAEQTLRGALQEGHPTLDELVLLRAVLEDQPAIMPAGWIDDPRLRYRLLRMKITK